MRLSLQTREWRFDPNQVLVERTAHFATPDFLLNLVGSMNFMRLSEKKQVLD
jgi:hypothetical protein